MQEQHELFLGACCTMRCLARAFGINFHIFHQNHQLLVSCPNKTPSPSRGKVGHVYIFPSTAPIQTVDSPLFLD